MLTQLLCAPLPPAAGSRWSTSTIHDKLRAMVSKRKDIPWGELGDLRGELFEWLVAQNLADAKDAPMKAVFKLHSGRLPRGSLTRAVTAALMEIESFVAAGDRADGRALEKVKDLDTERAQLMVDDSLEREADRAIRGLIPTIWHIERLTAKISEKRVARARAQRLAPDDKKVEALEDLVVGRLVLLERQARLLRRAFLKLNPAVARDGLTLSGCRRLEKRLRRNLQAAGFPPTKPARRS